jgi:molybdopterin-binding protein
LVPVDEDGIELFAKLKDERDVMVEIKVARNPRFHRLFFAICGFVKMHSPLMCDQSIDEIKDALKIATGYVTRHVDLDTAQTFLVCKSIAWESCDQLEFNRFFDAACQVVANRWMPPGVTPEAVRRELILMVDGPHAVDRRSA